MNRLYVISEDARSRSNGRVRTAITQILRRPRGLLVDQFDSKEDLINAVLASSFIPGYTAPQPATLFHNQLCIDGALVMLMPPISAAQTGVELELRKLKRAVEAIHENLLYLKSREAEMRTIWYLKRFFQKKKLI